MYKKILAGCILFFFVLIIMLNSVSALEWKTDSFGGTVTVNSAPVVVNTTWISKSFGGGTVTVHGFTDGDWYEWWKIGGFSKPEFSNPNPPDGSNGIPLSFTWNVTINNPDGNIFNWSIECNNGQEVSATQGSNGSKSLSLSGLKYNTQYTVWVNATNIKSESLSNFTSYTFNTTTGLDATNPYPVNNSDSVSKNQYNISVDISDPEGDSFNWSIETVPDIGSNSSHNDGNGSKQCIISGNLSYQTLYTWFVNVTDGNVTGNYTYYFTVEDLDTVSNVLVKHYDSQGINLTWSKNNNVTNTYIRYAKGDDAPSTRSSGVFLVNTTDTFYNHSGLSYGTRYSYSLWGYNGTDIIHSNSYISGYNYTNPGGPSSLQDTGSGLTSISLAWDKGINATRSVVYVNQSGVANYPNRTNGVIKINTTGNTGTATGLTNNVTYWFSVYSFNPDTGLWSESNSTDNASTVANAGDVSSITATRFNDVQINLSWTKANDDDDVVVRRKTGSYPTSPTDGVSVYNGSLLTKKDTGLTPATKYYYRAWAWNGEEFGSGSATTTQITRPSPPDNFTGEIDSGNLIISWDRGTGAARTVIRNNTGSYPSNPKDGTLVTNSTNDPGEATVTGTSSIDYYRAWSFVVVDGEGIFSPSVNLIWGGLEINVYKEDEPWIAIGNYTVFITNADATESYQSTSGNNPFRIDVSDVPNGEDITVQISKSGYNTRSQIMDLYENAYYTTSFYLPASEEGSPDGESGEDWYIPPVEDEVELQTVTESVVDYTTDETVITSCIIGDIKAVYVYNDSIYGGWREIGTDNYSYSGHTVTVDSGVLDKNSSVIKVEYYCGYSEEYSEHYILQVIDERQQTVGDAKITISRYINTTDDYETMYIIRTDSNGQQSVDLIPDIIYHIVITHDDYDTDTSDWSPPVVEYEADISKVFVLEFPDVTPSQPDNPVEKISVSVIMSGSSIWVNYTDETGLTNSMYITIYETNNSDMSFGLWGAFSYNPGSDFNTFSHEFTGVNNSNFYNIYLMYNHSYYGYSPVTLSFTAGAESQNRSGTIDDTFSALFGYNPFGWHNFIMWVVLIIGFMYIDERDSGVFVIILGGIILFMNAVVGFYTNLSYVSGGIVPFLFILFGIISMWNKKGRKY